MISRLKELTPIIFAITLISPIINAKIFNQSQWELSTMPVLGEMPAIDNGGDMYGGRGSITNFFYNYQDTFELGIEASIAHFKTTNKQDKPDFSKDITIYSPAVVGRWYFTKLGKFNPFLAAGIGPSYMTNNDFGGRSLGIRYSFQDIGGLGVKFKDKDITGNGQFIAGLYIIHYSNASLGNNNRGITIPFSFKLAYRF